MGSKGFLSLLGVLAYCASARAETFAIDLSAARTVDPAATFEADCLGDSQADDCSVRAALLTTELVDLLGSLETSTDTDSVALFETAAQLPDPELQSIAMRYFASRGTVPDDIWTRARDFFFGPDPTVGQPAAELLERSSDTQDQMLSELYLEGRPEQHVRRHAARDDGSDGYLGARRCGTMRSSTPWALFRQISSSRRRRAC